MTFQQNPKDAEIGHLNFELCPCPHHLHEQYSILRKDFKVPPKTELHTRVLDDAYSMEIARMSSAALLPCLFAPTLVIDNKLFILILGLNEELEYVHIDENIIEITEVQDSREKLKLEIQHFFDETIKLATKKYKKRFISIVYDYDGDLDVYSNIDFSLNYIRTKNIQMLLKDLRNINKRQLNVDFFNENEEAFESYQSKLKSLEKVILDRATSIGEAINIYLKFFFQDSTDFLLNAVELVSPYVVTFTLGCHIVNHE